MVNESLFNVSYFCELKIFNLAHRKVRNEIRRKQKLIRRIKKQNGRSTKQKKSKKKQKNKKILRNKNNIQARMIVCQIKFS